MFFVLNFNCHSYASLKMFMFFIFTVKVLGYRMKKKTILFETMKRRPCSESLGGNGTGCMCLMTYVLSSGPLLQRGVQDTG